MNTNKTRQQYKSPSVRYSADATVMEGVETVTKYELENSIGSFAARATRRLESYSWEHGFVIQFDLRGFLQVTRVMAMFMAGTSAVLRYKLRNCIQKFAKVPSGKDVMWNKLGTQQRLLENWNWTRERMSNLPELYYDRSSPTA